MKTKVFRWRHGFPGLYLDPMGAGMVCGPTIAVPDLMLADQSNRAFVPLIIRKHDMAHALADPRAGGRRAMTQEKDLQLRQPLLDHMTMKRVVVLRRRLGQHDHAI